MRPAGSPGTCGAGFRVAARGDPLYAPSPQPEPATTYGCQTAPDRAAESATAVRTALPAQRTRPRVTDAPPPATADSATPTEEAVR